MLRYLNINYRTNANAVCNYAVFVGVDVEFDWKKASVEKAKQQRNGGVAIRANPVIARISAKWKTKPARPKATQIGSAHGFSITASSLLQVKRALL